MNFPLLSLELRKNRLSAASVAAAFFVTLPVARLVASATGMEPGNALSTILVAWAFAGLPFAAALIGATAGAGVASNESREAEALLPARPARRAAASLSSAALLLSLVAALILLAAWLGNALAPWLVEPDKAFSWGRPFWQNMPVTPFFALMIANILAASWIISYLIGHGVAGGLLGPALVCLETFGVGVCIGLRVEHGPWLSPLGGRPMLQLPELLLGFLVLVKLAALPASARLERRPVPRLPAYALVASVLLAGPLVCWLSAGWLASGLNSRLRFAEPSPAFNYQSWFNESSPTPAALSAAGRSAALMTVRGGVLLAGKNELRVVIPEEKSGILDLIFSPWDRAWLFRTLRDPSGRLWAERVTSLDNELWRQEGDAVVLGRHSARGDLDNLSMVGGRLVVSKYKTDPKTGGSKSYYASADEFLRLGNKAPYDPGLNGAIAAGEKASGAAIVDCGGRCLRLGSRRWTLPGKALEKAPAFPLWVAGKPAYLIPFRDAAGPAAALCRADGSVAVAWRLGARRAHGDFYALPDGTLYAYEPGDTMGLIGADGKLASFRYGRLRPAGDAGLPALVRRQGDRSWLLWDKTLTEVSDDGLLLSTVAVPENLEYRVLNDGLMYDDGRALAFRAWDGTTRRLTKP